ncbi:MAG: ribokinase [Acidimicrobiales bacterium]
MSEVLVVGSYNVGLSAFGRRLPERGETIVCDTFDNGPGGKGANQAMGAKRLGADVALVTKLGRDVFGGVARNVLLGEGLPGWGLLTGSAPTGVALIMVEASGENMIAIAPGANLELTSAEVLALGEAVTDARVVLLQLECSPTLATEMGHWARDSGKVAVLNPAPVRDLATEDLGCFDIITPNEGELARLALVAGVGGACLEDMALGLVKVGVPDVVVTLGERGVLWASARGVRVFEPYRVRVVDTTGAGDAFNAGLVTALAAGAAIEHAIDQGSRAGAYCTTRKGVLDGLGKPGDLQALER